MMHLRSGKRPGTWVTGDHRGDGPDDEVSVIAPPSDPDTYTARDASGPHGANGVRRPSSAGKWLVRKHGLGAADSENRSQWFAYPGAGVIGTGGGLGFLGASKAERKILRGWKSQHVKKTFDSGSRARVGPVHVPRRARPNNIESGRQRGDERQLANSRVGDRWFQYTSIPSTGSQRGHVGVRILPQVVTGRGRDCARSAKTEPSGPRSSFVYSGSDGAAGQALG